MPKAAKTTRRRTRSAQAPSAPAPVRPVGRARYTVERFLSDCSEPTRQWLLDQWGEGNQLRVDDIPPDALPPVLILAAYGLTYEVDLVDDFDALIEKYCEEEDYIFHPDKFMASCIIILDEKGQMPSQEAFDAINLEAIYEELLP